MAVITVGSLFSGIGGLDLGLERAGMEVRWQVEIDDYCSRVLAKHWPNVKRHRDVREVGSHNLEPVDLICGGFPCQPHSLAGKRKGKDDDRNLWPEYLRVVRELRPTWVLGENVPGIRTTILDDILDDLEALGYATRTFDIPAVAVGAPHLRHRFFIVADANGTGREEQRWPIAMGKEQRPVECGGEALANAEGQPLRARLCEVWQAEQRGRRSGDGSCQRPDLSNANREPVGRLANSWGECSQWAVEPNVGRVANGVPSRVDRLRALGNAVVPQVAEYIGRMIVAADECL